MFEYDDWEGEFPLPENIFKWDVDMIRWLAKKFQVDADNQSADPSGDNQHEIMEIPFQMWGYTGFDIGSSYAQVSPSATAFSVYQVYIDGSNANFIENFVDVFFADRDYSGITSANYTRFYEYCQDIQLDFPATEPYNYFYYHFNYPETRQLHYGNANNYRLYTYDDNNEQNFNCFSNALSQHNNTYGFNSLTQGSYLSLDFVKLTPSSTVNGYQTFNNWFRTSAYDDSLSGQYAYMPIATDLPLYSIGMDNGVTETQFQTYITNSYNTSVHQTSTYTTENGDTVTIYQGDNIFYIDDDDHGLTYDDLFNVFNDTILPFINVNQGTDITFPSYDEIKYIDMGSFYITPVKQIPALPDAPDVSDVSIDVSDYVKILGGSVTKLTNIFGGIGLDLMLVFTFLSCLVIRHLKR